MSEEKLLKELRAENARLSRQVEHDELTGLLSRGATERRVGEILAQKGGALLVADLDRFKEVNDRFGHIVGDRLLQKAAELMGYLAAPGDLLGRVGGDEFVMFLTGCQDERAAEERSQMIQRRFRQFRRSEGQGLPLSVTTGLSVSLPGDTYQTLFDRADQQLLARKEAGRASGAGRKSLVRDVQQIREELVEQALTPGAYCQDYATFKSIYRFIERGMQRSDQQACVILLTLMDGGGEFPPLQNREQQMELLGTMLQRSLRAGDVFTRYSSCQYLVLVVNVTTELADQIAHRVCALFDAQTRQGGLLLHYCYPLRPAGKP